MFVSDDMTILPHGILPTCTGYGYAQVGNDIWEALTPIDRLNIKTLCIESGCTESYASEYGNEKDNKAPGPLELYLTSTIGFGKGMRCISICIQLML